MRVRGEVGWKSGWNMKGLGDEMGCGGVVVN